MQREATGLFRAVMENARALVDADRATLYLVDEAAAGGASEAAGLPEAGGGGGGGAGAGGRRRDLYSRVGDVSIRVPFGSGSLVGHVAVSGKPLNVRDVYADSRFNPEVAAPFSALVRLVITTGID